MDRLPGKEVVFHRINTRIDSLIIVDDGGEILEDESALCVGESSNESVEIVTASASHINQQHVLIVSARPVDDSFLDRIPIHPVRPPSPHTCHESVEPFRKLHVLGPPFERGYIHIESILEGSILLVLRRFVAEFPEVLRQLEEDREPNVETSSEEQ